MRKFDKQKFKFKNEYLEKNVYHGLTNLNTGWDAPSIFYFNEADFETVLNRVEKLGLKIHGIEPWLGNLYYDVRLFNNSDSIFIYRKAFDEFKNSGEKLQYSASYFVPEELLNLD